MKYPMFLALITIAVSSCAHPRILRKDVPDEEVRRDDAYCRAQAAMIQTADWAYRGTFMEGAAIKRQQNEVHVNCMISKGYVEEVRK